MKIIKNSFEKEWENGWNHHHQQQRPHRRHRYRWYNEFLLVEYHGLMVSNKDSADRLSSNENTIQNSNHFILSQLNFSVPKINGISFISIH